MWKTISAYLKCIFHPKFHSSVIFYLNVLSSTYYPLPLTPLLKNLPLTNLFILSFFNIVTISLNPCKAHTPTTFSPSYKHTGAIYSLFYEAISGNRNFACYRNMAVILQSEYNRSCLFFKFIFKNLQ